MLGAEAFAQDPPLPLESIVAALNIDSPAIAPAGQPWAIIGHGLTPLDADISRVARSLKLRLEPSAAADGFLRRQDGWALLQHDIPAVMVSSSYADADRLARFMDSAYHRPGDELRTDTDLSGAVEATRVQTALARWFANVRSFPERR